MAANPYFQFKAFRVEQGSCAMKVSTDACILGALVPALEEQQRAIDIGTGTGLLALMLAQRSHRQSLIDAIELDLDSAQQAAANILASPWAPQIHVSCSAIQQFQPSSGLLYQRIVSNPPFFQSGSRSNQQERAAARHTDLLPFADLWAWVNQWLAPEGDFWVLLPSSEMHAFRGVASQFGFICRGGVQIAPKAGALVHREVSRWTREEGGESWQRLDVRTAAETYSPEFIELLQPYYLHL